MSGITNLGSPPPANYRGHIFLAQVENGLEKWSAASAVAVCQACGLKVTPEQAEYGVLEPCPETTEGRALIAQAEAAKPPPITGPSIAVPETWEGTDAEAVGLAVAGAVGAVARERDLALQHLGALVTNYPETSWAAGNQALDAAKAFLADMGRGDPEAKS